MNPHLWLVSLLLLGVPGIFPALHAQDPNERPSHRLLIPELADDLKPGDLAKRLELARASKPFKAPDEVLQQDLRQFAELLRKGKNWESLLDKTSKQDQEDLTETLNKLKEGLPTGNAETLKKLLEAGKDFPNLDARDKELLKRLGEKFKNLGDLKQPMPGPVRNGPTPDNQPPPPPARMPTPPQQEQSPWKRFGSEEWLKNNLDKWVKDLDKWADSPSSKSLRDALRNVANNPLKSQAPNLGERARSLTRYLPRVSEYLPRNLLPKTSMPRLPALPSLGGLPGAPRLPAAPGAGTGKALLWLVVLGVLALVLWRSGGLWQKYQAARKGTWRLGPWPVRPDKVSTRADLVRAFEHLALLCLGPTARTCHHLELGDRIAEQPTLDPRSGLARPEDGLGRRRDAARTLARLYEQARYTPDGEPLQSEMMTIARRELCYLAGVVPA